MSVGLTLAVLCIGTVAGLLIGAIGVGGVILVPTLLLYPDSLFPECFDNETVVDEENDIETCRVQTAILSCMLCYFFAGLSGVISYEYFSPFLRPIFKSLLFGSALQEEEERTEGENIQEREIENPQENELKGEGWKKDEELGKEAEVLEGQEQVHEGVQKEVAKVDHETEDIQQVSREESYIFFLIFFFSGVGAIIGVVLLLLVFESSSVKGILFSLIFFSSLYCLWKYRQALYCSNSSSCICCRKVDQIEGEEPSEGDEKKVELGEIGEGTLEKDSGQHEEKDKNPPFPFEEVSLVICVVLGLVAGSVSAITGTSGPVVLLPLVLSWPLQLPPLFSLRLAQTIQVPIAFFSVLAAWIVSEGSLPLFSLTQLVALSASIIVGVIFGSKVAHVLPAEKLKIIISVVLVVVSIFFMARIVKEEISND
eukprot:CAMPEP_0201481232 /NCGR_PEP_ID=MMETSP0151_2-20130828/5523_1 /ASSEMBLY_ACC=CAM_ASM_000257 /TAXON_ID=200890 /ORGANISM="Paramoeba atlantica, Strain 621/1 / CCAP 1560/9" /LENGTH=425 /DNA_ID=CAMNT_0047863323 /DNA_START=142 /DNA_END=1419 /DNA_ORIENTATION=+